MLNAIERKEYALKRRQDGKLQVRMLGYTFAVTDSEWELIKKEYGSRLCMSLLSSRIVDYRDENTYWTSPTFERILTEEEMAAKKGLML